MQPASTTAAANGQQSWITVMWQRRDGLKRFDEQVNVGRRLDGSTWATARQERSLPLGIGLRVRKAALGPAEAERAQKLLSDLTNGLAAVPPTTDKRPLSLTGPGRVAITVERNGATTWWVHDIKRAPQAVADVLAAARELSIAALAAAPGQR